MSGYFIIACCQLKLLNVSVQFCFALHRRSCKDALNKMTGWWLTHEIEKSILYIIIIIQLYTFSCRVTRIRIVNSHNTRLTFDSTRNNRNYYTAVSRMLHIKVFASENLGRFCLTNVWYSSIFIYVHSALTRVHRYH